MYNFKEKDFSPSFAKEKLKDFKTLIDRGISFVVMSMPGVGASYFLRYLATKDFALFFHIDLYLLPSLSLREFYKLLVKELGANPSKGSDEELFEQAEELLKELDSKTSKKIVLIFSRFDQLKKSITASFLSNLQSLASIAPGKIVLIFTSIKPLTKLVPEAITGGNLNFYSEILYFKPFLKEDLRQLLKIEPGRLTSKENLERLLDLCGGHNQLLHIFLSSQKQQNLMLDQFVKHQLKELIDYLDYSQKKQIQKISLRQGSDKVLLDIDIDEDLLGVGLVKKERNGHFSLFTPLLADYIKFNYPSKLPIKEAKLFKLLRKSIGNIVSKDQIFNEVWGDSNEASDWALDALIYRLRKHPFLKSHGYIIESQKKIGYMLIQT